VIASEIHHNLVNTHVIVSGLERKATSTGIMISDIHRAVVKSDGKNVLVSDTWTVSTAE